jgi:hypothetical protein
VGLAAVPVTGGTERDVRQGIPGRLASGQLQIVCTCDLYNEGVDLPDINTLLLLRSTQGPVLFDHCDCSEYHGLPAHHRFPQRPHPRLQHREA